MQFKSRFRCLLSGSRCFPTAPLFISSTQLLVGTSGKYASSLRGLVPCSWSYCPGRRISIWSSRYLLDRTEPHNGFAQTLSLNWLNSYILIESASPVHLTGRHSLYLLSSALSFLLLMASVHYDSVIQRTAGCILL